MPEDLPVRKCINVMVGITRSNVILSTFTTTIVQYHSSIVGFEVSKVPWGGKSLAHFKLEWMYLTKKNVGQDFASPNLEQHRKDEI